MASFRAKPSLLPMPRNGVMVGLSRAAWQLASIPFAIFILFNKILLKKQNKISVDNALKHSLINHKSDGLLECSRY
jgi:hypothetical protein